MSESVEFGNAIKRIRNNKGLSQEELAFLSGLHRTYISDIERGTRNVSLSNIIRLSKALEILPSRLFMEMENITNDSR